MCKEDCCLWANSIKSLWQEFLQFDTQICVGVPSLVRIWKGWAFTQQILTECLVLWYLCKFFRGKLDWAALFSILDITCRSQVKRDFSTTAALFILSNCAKWHDVITAPALCTELSTQPSPCTFNTKVKAKGKVLDLLFQILTSLMAIGEINL